MPSDQDVPWRSHVHLEVVRKRGRPVHVAEEPDHDVEDPFVLMLVAKRAKLRERMIEAAAMIEACKQEIEMCERHIPLIERLLFYTDMKAL